MQSGYRDQMRNAGCACDRPFVFAHGVLIAERECAQKIRARAFAECSNDGIAYTRAKTVYAQRVATQPYFVVRFAHRTDGDDAAFERVAFGVETTRIDRAAR